MNGNLYVEAWEAGRRLWRNRIAATDPNETDQQAAARIRAWWEGQGIPGRSYLITSSGV